MHIRQLHRWDVTPAEAIAIQQGLRGKVLLQTAFGTVHYVAGVDIGFGGEKTRAAVVVLKYPLLEVADTSLVEEEVRFPYIPGLLSFRETPPILSAFEGLATEPDLILVDGQGIAHPRRFGIASHLGLILDKPTIGCAKSLLCGQHGPLADEPGSLSFIYDEDEVIGAAVRTKSSTKAVYVSVGHKIDLSTAIEYVLSCTREYRLPEPTRLAHLLAGGSPLRVDTAFQPPLL
ncbi:MAG: deoxyribonuclease V [Chloroflexi bacterium]|nr:deoxyribonuclease V [Chloroflexota bacterium]MCL5075914.1 deoxyribonuclease V [Chloroflexota bacterium]